MILAYAIILLVVLALLLRRDLTALGQISWRGGWTMPAIIAGLFFMQWLLVVYASERAIWQMVLLALSHLALILLFILNRHLPGAKLFILGILLNTLVMVANGGWMPITPENRRYIHPDQSETIETKPLLSKNIVLPHSQTHFWPLSDIIRVPLPWRRFVISLGDILLVMAVAQFIFQTTTKKTNQTIGVDGS